MGTRNLVAVMIDGEYKVAQYGQWDGYPDGQGVTLLKILSSVDLNELATAVRNCSWITAEEIEDLYVECGAERGAEFVDWAIGQEFSRRHPELSRDTGAEVLNVIMDNNGCRLKNSIKFAEDSLFCEWAYVVDFDKRTVEVYKGFSQEPDGDGARFKRTEESTRKYGDEYYAVKLVKTYSLDDLPSTAQFLDELREPDEEDEEVDNSGNE